MERVIWVLHLEDDPRDAELIRQKLKADGPPLVIAWVDRKDAFESALARERFDLVLSDYNLPDYDGMSALRHVRQNWPELPVIVISGTVGEEEAIECLKAGATDYILKQRPQRLGAAVIRALAEQAKQEKRREMENALHESEERFRSAMHYSSTGMALVAPDGRWLEVNQALCRLTGYSEQELLATNFQSITHADDLTVNLENVRRILAREIDSYQIDKRYIRKDGTIVWIQLGASLLWTKEGQPRHFISQIQDITQRKRDEERIRRLVRMHTLLSGINALIVRVRDRRQLFDEACQLAVTLGGFAFAWIGSPAPGDAMAIPVTWAGQGDGYLEEVGEALESMAQDPGTGGRALRERRVIVANDIEHDPAVVFKVPALARGFRSLAVLPLLTGEEPASIFVLYARTPEFFDAEEVLLLKDLANDISFALDNIEKEAQLDYLAYYDALTGLPNRALFLDRCNQLIRAAGVQYKSIAVIALDLARFRQINETLGRHAGDFFLKCLALRLKASNKGKADIARLAGDNFALVLPGIRDDADAARIFEDEIFPAIDFPIEFEGREYRLSARAGITLGPAEYGDAEALLQNAEAALARAKSSGERRVFYEPEMNDRVGERLFMENKLRTALKENQFVLHYQPKVDASTREIIGLEALLRWADPDTGLVAPANFIPLLEETGMIVEVGRWAMGQALSDRSKWQQDGIDAPRVAVNVSAVQLQQQDFAGTVREIIARHPELFEQQGCGLDLEITESVFMTDIESNVEKLKAIRDLGIRIYVDDFGTGYSSLSYIARLPIHALKIDRSFVNGMTTHPNDRTIVSIIILLGHSLNISVVAEGVETEEQLSLLGILQCDEVQGYLLGRPVPADQIVALLSPSVRA